MAGIAAASGGHVEIVATQGQAHGVVRGRPRNWCAPPRRNDPLLLDARKLTASNNKGSELDDPFILHRMPVMPPNQIVMVVDEAICERAARAYDSARLTDRNGPVPARIEAVHVVALGRVYLVESAGDRKRGYEVKVFDASWKPVRGGFGTEF